jgi:hypothetical protein
MGASLTASAEGAKTVYYVGEAATTRGANVERHTYILARTTDPEANTIAEKVVSFQGTTYVENFSVMRISQNQITMTESTGTVTGGGTLTGKPWNWTFLRAEFKVPKQNMRIVDYNFLADPSSLAGHKDFYITNSGVESLFMQEDVVLHPVDQSAYETKRKELLKPRG